MMGGGGGAGRISWWWWWGGAFASTRWDDGLGGKKTTKPSVMAQFQVCCVNWWLGVIGEGGRVAWMMWGWRRSLVFSNTRGGRGLELIFQNRAIVARFRAAFVLQDVEGAAVGLWPLLSS